MTESFSAGPQAVGYLHQIRYALYALLRESDEEAAVIIEGLDDVEVRGEHGVVRLDQLKHHIKGSATLTDLSTDLWKTIRIWSNQLRSKAWDAATTRLYLVTTATAAEGSAASYLGYNNRDISSARQLLVEAIAKSRTSSAALLQAFSEFKGLTESEQMRMLNAIIISDGAHTIADLPNLIKQYIRLAAPPDSFSLDQLYEQIEGWWFDRAVDHLLNNSKNPLTFMALWRKIWLLRDQLRESNLPIEYAAAVPEHIIDPELDNRVFVQQLRCLDVQSERIKKIALDYYRAYEQRSSWVRQHLLIDDELMQYERKLIDAWDEYRLALMDELADRELPSENSCRRVGLQILRWVQVEVDIRIRQHVDERYVIKGSYHMLADSDRPQVYWHPKFLERLEELLTS